MGSELEKNLLKKAWVYVLVASVTALRPGGKLPVPMNAIRAPGIPTPCRISQ
jgi:hypothetical protein